MGTNERRSRERAERRQLILATARALFEAHGVDTTSVDMIAERAELAKGTLYLYFKSKEELLIALLEEDLTQLRTQAALLDQVPSARLALELLLRAALAFYQRRPIGFLPFFRSPSREIDTFLRERLAQQRDAMLDVLAGLVRKGQAQGELHPHYDALGVARMMWSQFMGTVMLAESGGVPDLEAQFDLIFAIVRGGLATA